MSNLVIVESPSKAATIKNYLGSNYKVVASVGHIRDLPKSSLGVDIENGFEPHYINIRGKGDLINDLKKQAKAANKVFLATDPDREGEAISWHLANVLDIPLDKTLRVTFNEITKNAVTSGIKKPRNIDMDLVNSQQARRILDRIVGYKLSPFLWKNVRSGLSAGRVQSVATKIIVDREEQIRAFIPEEYWTIETDCTDDEGIKFTAKFYGDEKGRVEISGKEEADKILNELNGCDFIVSDIKNSVKSRKPLPPFTTSTMQQDASRKLGFSSSRTMKVAQELYEGISLGSEHGGAHGLITYMRTDSLRLSDEARSSAKEIIISDFGEKFYPDKPHIYKTKSGAQDAHEAIRPTNALLKPADIRNRLSSDQYKLYKLIWERFIASQMASASYNTMSADIGCGKYIFKASGQALRFKGYLALYEDITDEENGELFGKLPKLSNGKTLKHGDIIPAQHFTEPPARFTEGTLVKFLEEKGIGRPSTFAPTISLIISRGYVERDGKSLRPTALGETTTKLISEYFDEIVDYKFTAQMETELDEIANRNTTMEETLSKFYDRFASSLDKAENSIKKEDINVPVEETDIICDKCGAKMIIKSGRYGKFAACPNYPACKNTKNLTENTRAKAPAEPTDMICELCGSPVVKRRGRYGEFYSCSNYPKCKYTYNPINKIGVKCPDCGGDLVEKTKGKTVFYSCENYPKCKFSSWDRPTNHKCPDCGGILYYKKSKKILVCKTEGCGHTEDGTPEEI